MNSYVLTAVIASLLEPGFTQIFPGSYVLNPSALSENGSSSTGYCSNVSDSGRVCNTPRTSVLFDGIPTLPGLDGDMWASQLLTLNTSTALASVSYNFNGATNVGVEGYTGVEIIEVVMLNCPSRGIGANTISFIGDGSIGDINTIPESCEQLVRVCIDLSTTSRMITSTFNSNVQLVYLAEVTFYTNPSRSCPPDGIIDGSILTQTTLPTTSVLLSTSEDGVIMVDSSTATVYTTPSTNSEPCTTGEAEVSGTSCTSQLVAASITSFIIGTITGAVGGVMILLLIIFLVNKARIKSHGEESNNNTHRVVYDEVNIDGKVKSSSDIQLQGNSAYGQLS